MGVVETLIHTFDMVHGLNPADQWRPPTELAAPVVARLFPHAPSGDPADVLLYCCGRAVERRGECLRFWPVSGAGCADGKRGRGGLVGGGTVPMSGLRLL